MKNLILILGFCVMAISCNRNNDENTTNSTVDAVIYVYLKNAEGADLLGTTNYTKENINISYLEPSSLPNNNYFEIATDLNGYKFIKIFLNYGDKNSNTASTIVKWNNNEKDVFKAFFTKGKNYAILEKVYMNDQLVCPDREHKTVTIIK